MFKAQRGGTLADKSQPPEPDMTIIPKATTSDMNKNPYAVALGKMGRGKPKTGLSPAERLRRSNLAKANLEKIHARRKQLVTQ